MNLDKYIGLKYEHLGRGPRFDCIGLVLYYYDNELGITLPTYTDLNYERHWYRNHNYIIDYIEEEFKVVSAPLKNDMLLFRLDENNSVVNHCGIYLDDYRILHITESTTSCISKLTTFYNSRFEKAVRPKALCR